MLILGVETSGKMASVAFCNEQGVLSQISVLANKTHSQIIMPLVKDCLKNVGFDFCDIDGFTVSKGPGSYTGLRIGIASVKAFAFAENKSCCGVSTLESLAYNLQGFNGFIRPVMKARGDLVYTALFECDYAKITRICDDEIRSVSDVFDETYKLNKRVIINGDYAVEFTQKCSENNIILAPPQLRLQLASSLCYAAFAQNKFVTPNQLNAEYMELTKAEKDLN